MGPIARTIPRNFRSKSPRSLATSGRGASRDPQRAYRCYPSPTPPPVTVALAPGFEAAPEPADEPRERRASGATAAWVAALLLILACAASAVTYRRLRAVGTVESTITAAALAIGVPRPAAEEKTPQQKTPGWAVQHEGYAPIDGGVLVVPASFRTEGGGYDLVVHFHGDVEIVRQSLEHAGVNAALAIVNWGVGSAAYRQPYEIGGTFEKLLAQIDKAVERRGVPRPSLRRLALSAWGAGYAAVHSILEHRRAPHADADPLDAIILLDGVRCGLVDGDSRRPNARTIAPFVRAAQAAAQGQLLFTLTHSEVDSDGYASTRRTAAMLLGSVGAKVHKAPMDALPPRVLLDATAHAASKDTRMVPTSDTSAGRFRVKGYQGRTQQHHAAHLTQMAAVGLPELVVRWRAAPAHRR